MIAYLHAFWAGQVDGSAFWLTLAGLGLLCIAAVWIFAWAVGAITDYLAAHESPLEDELTPLTDDARQARRAVESLCLLVATVAIATQL